MNIWLKIGIVVITTGLTGGCTFAAGHFTAWAMPLGYASLFFAAVGTTLAGWPPKTTT